jgi:membrane protease YdiL (CAAX protease family)
MSEDERAPRPDEHAGATAPPQTPRPGMSLPRTIYIWLALLVIGFVAPLLMERRAISMEPTATAAKSDAVSAQDFERFAEAEQATRSGFADDALLRRSGFRELMGSSQKSIEKQRQKAWSDALTAYKKLAKTTRSPNVARRILIIDHALGRPLDPAVLERDLVPDLRAAGTKQGEIEKEQALWRRIYGGGKAPRTSGAVPAEAEARVRGMRLRFLQNRVLADVYTAYGDTTRARAAQQAFDDAALADRARQLGFGVAALLGLVIGGGLLLYFSVHAYERRWSAIGRYTQPYHPLGYGDLADAFVFYFAMVLLLRPVTGVVVARLFPDPTIRTVLGIMAVAYLTPAVLAFLYLQRTLRRRGATLADVGLVIRPDVWRDVAYGVAGYLAALPITLGLGMVSRYLFRHDTTITPNPIMPLIVADREAVGRLVIFILAAVAAPFFEELFFRGVLYTGLRTRFSSVLSIILSAVLFAVGHPIQDWLPIFGLGFVFATMREMRQSLVPSMTAHVLQNGMTFVALSLLFSS